VSKRKLYLNSSENEAKEEAKEEEKEEEKEESTKSKKKVGRDIRDFIVDKPMEFKFYVGKDLKQQITYFN
jgi:hypothetical protein